MVMNFTDRMFLMWESPEAMAAAAPAGMLVFTAICFPLGIAMFAITFVGQYAGAGRSRRAARVTWQAVWLGVMTVPLMLATIPLAPWMFEIAGHDASTVLLEAKYYQAASFGAGATVIAAAMSAFFIGRGKTGTVMIVDSAAAGLNLVLDYLLIFGHGGFPAWGIEGAAWATVVAQWAKVLAYGLLMMSRENRTQHGTTDQCRFDGALMRRLLYFGVPSGLQLLVEVLAFSLFLMLMGRLGQDAMVVTVMAFNISGLAFVPMMGLGFAVSSMVGQQLGSNRADLAARATWNAFGIAMVYTGLMGLLFIVVPEMFLWGFAKGVDPIQFEPLRKTTVILLRFVAAYCLFDAMNLMFVNALKGAGDTRFILKISLFTSGIPVALGWFGIQVMGRGLFWCWMIVTGWICSLGIIYLLRFLQGHWREMRVIEHETEEPVRRIADSELASELSVLPTVDHAPLGHDKIHRPVMDVNRNEVDDLRVER